jgi:SsrA-binding protein
VPANPETRDLVVNRKARHEYYLEDHWEAGISLLGPEVKSLRAGRGNLQEAYVSVDREGAVIHGFHISPYTQANRFNADPVRPRRLLLNQSELAKLEKGAGPQGMTIVPVRVYLKGRLVKVEIALGKGKKLHDKRESIKEREATREMARSR